MVERGDLMVDDLTVVMLGKVKVECALPGGVHYILLRAGGPS